MKLSNRKGLRLLLASHTVPIAIEAAAVSRLTVVDRGGPGRAGGRAVGIIRFIPPASTIGRLRGDQGRGDAVAVIPTVLPVVVATFRIQAPRVREDTCDSDNPEQGKGLFLCVAETFFVSAT
jgi:hypothetical protein